MGLIDAWLIEARPGSSLQDDTATPAAIPAGLVGSIPFLGRPAAAAAHRFYPRDNAVESISNFLHCRC